MDFVDELVRKVVRATLKELGYELKEEHKTNDDLP